MFLCDYFLFFDSLFYQQETLCCDAFLRHSMYKYVLKFLFYTKKNSSFALQLF